MLTLQEAMNEYQRQLQQGVLQVAYKGLLDTVLSLRAHICNQYPTYFVSGVYPGYMDMTYFSVVPASLKQRGLKIAVVFLHPAFRFEVWLSGTNRQTQARYAKIIQESGWDKYPLANPAQNPDAILESILTAAPNFDDLPALTAQIETGTMAFLHDIEAFVARLDG